MTRSPEPAPSVGALVAAIGKVIILAGIVGVLAFVAWTILTG